MLTVGAVFAVYFASSGVESLRIGLNRAYDAVEERRSWLLLRLESIGYVLVGAVGAAGAVVPDRAGPLMFATALKYAPWLRAARSDFTFARYRDRDRA